MNHLDFIELWVESLNGFFSSVNVTVIFTRTEDDRPNQSCSITIRRDDFEVDFIVWESGFGELAITRSLGDPMEEHLDDLNNRKVLTVILANIIDEIIKK